MDGSTDVQQIMQSQLAMFSNRVAELEHEKEQDEAEKIQLKATIQQLEQQNIELQSTLDCARMDYSDLERQLVEERTKRMDAFETFEKSKLKYEVRSSVHIIALMFAYGCPL